MYKRNGVWWIAFRIEGRKVRKSLETKNRKLAEQIEAKIKLDVAQGRYFDVLLGKSKTVGEMMERFMAEHSPKVSDSMRRSYATSLNKLLPFFGNMQLLRVSPKVITAYKQIRLQEVEPSSVNREVSCLSKAFAIAWKQWEWVEHNPVDMIPREAEDNERDRWLAYEEEERLLAECSDRLKPIVIFALNTGIRENAILSLEWSNIDLFRRTVTLFREQSKNKKAYTVPLTSKAVELLKEEAKVRRIGTNYVFYSEAGTKIDASKVRSWFRQALTKAGIVDFRFHDLRHTFGTRLAQAGVDLYTIMKLMGHKDIQSTMRYAHHTTESLRRGIDVLELAGHNLVTSVQKSGEPFFK